MTQGKSVYKQSDADAESSSLLHTPSQSTSAPGYLASNPATMVPTDDVEFHQRQTYLLSGAGKKLIRGVPQTTAEQEKEIADGISAMNSFAHVWLGKAMPHKKDASHERHLLLIHGQETDTSSQATPLVLPIETAPMEYRYEQLNVGSHPLSSARSSSHTSDTDDLPDSRTLGSFTPKPSETQRTNRRERRERSRSPAKDLYAHTDAAPTSSAITIVNPLSPPPRYVPGSGSMDVDLASLRAREEQWSREKPSEKMEEFETDYIPSVFRVDDPDAPTAIRGLDSRKASESTLASRREVSFAEAETADKLTKVNEGDQPAIDVTPPTNSPKSTRSPLILPFGSSAAGRPVPPGPFIRSDVLSPSHMLYELSGGTKSPESSLRTAVKRLEVTTRTSKPPPPQKPAHKVEEKEEGWSAFRFHTDEEEPTRKSDEPVARFKTVELRPAVVTSHAFRIKALVGALAVRLDLGTHFQHLFHRHFGFHAELERVFVSPLTGFVYVQYSPGRLPSRHIEEVIREALVSEGHICCDVTAISMAVMKDETFRCLYNLSRGPAPGSGVAETDQEEMEETGVPKDLDESSKDDATRRRANSPTMKHFVPPPPPAKNLQMLLHMSMPTMSGRSSLVDELAGQLLQAPKSQLTNLNIDTPQLFPVRDPLHYNALANSFTNRSTWVSPYVAATQGGIKGSTAFTPRVQSTMSFMGSANTKRKPSDGDDEKLLSARRKSVPATRVRRESPAAVLTHTPGLLHHYGEVAAVLDAVSVGGSASPDLVSPQKTHYGYTTAASISAVHTDPNVPVMYLPLSARTPSRPSSNYRATPRPVRSETPQSAIALTPIDSQSARTHYNQSSASAPSSAPRTRVHMPPLAPAGESSRSGSSVGFDSRPASSEQRLAAHAQPRPPSQPASSPTQNFSATAPIPVAIKRTTFSFA
jgi:hypothetical protein